MSINLLFCFLFRYIILIWCWSFFPFESIKFLFVDRNDEFLKVVALENHFGWIENWKWFLEEQKLRLFFKHWWCWWCSSFFNNQLTNLMEFTECNMKCCVRIMETLVRSFIGGCWIKLLHKMNNIENFKMRNKPKSKREKLCKLKRNYGMWNNISISSIAFIFSFEMFSENCKNFLSFPRSRTNFLFYVFPFQ